MTDDQLVRHICETYSARDPWSQIRWVMPSATFDQLRGMEHNRRQSLTNQLFVYPAAPTPDAATAWLFGCRIRVDDAAPAPWLGVP